MTPTHDIWTDPDLRELVVTDPELVAIADAVAYAATVKGLRPRRTPTPRRARMLAAAAVLSVALAVALVMPWNRSSGSLSDLALAAIGADPVLHVIAETPTAAQLVDISTGRTEPVYQQQEIWFVASQGLKHELIRNGDTTVADVLETPDGAYSSTGRVYDCTWIAAHPAEATKAGVSCTKSGVNPATPNTVPRPKPTLDPGLSGFVDGYRQELVAGQARDGGSGQIDGRKVDWLIFETTGGSEKVALDGQSHKPVLIRFPSGQEQRIAMIETTAFQAADFARPTAADSGQRPSSGAATDMRALSLDEASVKAAVPAGRWAGSNIGGLRLVRAEQQSLLTGFADATSQQSKAGLELDFGSLRPDGRLDFTRDYIVTSEAPSRALGFANMWGFVHGADPPAGQIYQAIPQASTSGAPGLVIPSSLGFIVDSGTFVTLRASSPELVLKAARALGDVQRTP